MDASENYDDPARAAHDNEMDARLQAEIALLKEIDLNIDREDADGMFQDWQERARELNIPDVGLALRHYRAVYSTFDRLLTGPELPF